MITGYYDDDHITMKIKASLAHTSYLLQIKTIIRNSNVNIYLIMDLSFHLSGFFVMAIYL